MGNSITTLKNFWEYFTKKKGYTSLLTIIPFFVSVIVLLVILIVYSIYSIGISVVDFELLQNYLETANINKLSQVVTPDIINKIAYYGFFISIIFIILMLALNNSFYNIIKEHIINNKKTNILNTFKIGFTNSYGNFILKYLGYLLLPSILLSLVLLFSPLKNYLILSGIISTIFSIIFNYYFYSKLIGKNQGDYILPLSLGLVISLLRLIPYIGSLLGFVISAIVPMIFIYAHLLYDSFEND